MNVVTTYIKIYTINAACTTYNHLSTNHTRTNFKDVLYTCLIAHIPTYFLYFCWFFLLSFFPSFSLSFFHADMHIRNIHKRASQATWCLWAQYDYTRGKNVKYLSICCYLLSLSFSLKGIYETRTHNHIRSSFLWCIMCSKLHTRLHDTHTHFLSFCCSLSSYKKLKTQTQTEDTYIHRSHQNLEKAKICHKKKNSVRFSSTFLDNSLCGFGLPQL